MHSGKQGLYGAQRAAFGKQVAGPGIYGNRHVQARAQHHILPKHPVEQINAARVVCPNLIGIALACLGARRLLCGGLLGPFFAENAHIALGGVPHAAVQIHKAQLQRVFQAHIHAPAALFRAKRAGFPRHIGKAQRLEQARAKVFHQALTGFAPHNGRQHIGVHAVVFHFLAGLKGIVCVQKSLCPVCLQHHAVFLKPAAAAHGKQMAHRHRFCAARGKKAALVSKDICHVLVQGKFALITQHANGRAHKTFGKAVGDVPVREGIGGKLCLAHHFAAARHKCGVRAMLWPGQRAHKLFQRLGRHAHFCGRHARQGCARVAPGHRLLHAHRVGQNVVRLAQKEFFYIIQRFHAVSKLHKGLPPKI